MGTLLARSGLEGGFSPGSPGWVLHAADLPVAGGAAGPERGTNRRTQKREGRIWPGPVGGGLGNSKETPPVAPAGR